MRVISFLIPHVNTLKPSDVQRAAEAEMFDEPAKGRNGSDGEEDDSEAEVPRRKPVGRWKTTGLLDTHVEPLETQLTSLG
jgi:hypothetical protein